MTSTTAEGASPPTAGATDMAEETTDSGKGEEDVREMELAPEISGDESPSVSLREDQVQNAVNFLSHPKVQGSPVKFRRAFLEKKGLSSAEIDEAFRRVPDSSPSREAKVQEPSSPSREAKTKELSPVPSASTSGQTATMAPWKRPSQPIQQAKQQLPFVSRASPAGQARQQEQNQQYSTMADAKSTSTERESPLFHTIMPAPVAYRGFRWTQMVLALGVLTAAGAGTAVVARNYFLPRLKSWIRRIVSDEDADEGLEQRRAKLKPNPVEEAATAAAAAASAVVMIAKEIAESRAEEKQHRDALLRALELQREELSAMVTNMKDVVKPSGTGLASVSDQRGGGDGASLTREELRKELLTFASVMQEAAPAAGVLSTTRPDVMRTVGQGVRSPILAGQRGSPGSPGAGTVSQAPMGGKGEDTLLGLSDQTPGLQRRSQALAAGPPSSFQAPHPQSYIDVMEMVAKGQTPPGIKDIDDKPPNPNQAPSSSRMKPFPKPWERPQSVWPTPTIATNNEKLGTSQAFVYSTPVSSRPTSSGSSHEGSDVMRSPKPSTQVAISVVGTSASGQVASTESSPWWRRSPTLAASTTPAQLVPTLTGSASNATLRASTNQQGVYPNMHFVRPQANVPGRYGASASSSSMPLSPPFSSQMPTSSVPATYESAIKVRPNSEEVGSRVSETMVASSASTNGQQRYDNGASMSGPSDPYATSMEPHGVYGSLAASADKTFAPRQGEGASEAGVASLTERMVGEEADDARSEYEKTDLMADVTTDGQIVPLRTGIAPPSVAAEAAPRSAWAPPPAPKPIMQTALVAMGHKLIDKSTNTPLTASRESPAAREHRAEEQVSGNGVQMEYFNGPRVEQEYEGVVEGEGEGVIEGEGEGEGDNDVNMYQEQEIPVARASVDEVRDVPVIQV